MTVHPIKAERPQSRVLTTLRLIDVSWFETAKEVLETTNVKDREEFSQIVGAVISKLGNVESMAHVFGVSPVTLYRWISGSNLPAVYARDAVLKKLVELVDAHLETIRETT